MMMMMMIMKIAVIVILTSVSISWTESFVLSDRNINNIPFMQNGILTKKLEFKDTPIKDGPSPIQPPLFIGSFNIQTLTRKKLNKPDVMAVVERVILRYDLILILEIHTEEDAYMLRLLRYVNMYQPQEEVYNITFSERQNSTKEHYAFIYKPSKLKMITSESYDDPTVFYRKPLVVTFEAFTLRDMKKIGVVGHHVKPSQAVQEIHGLAEVYDYVKNTYQIEDVLLMGDFNADCTYVKEKDWDDIALWYRPEFTWAITNKVDTTTNYRSCALDRFVYAGESMNDGVILSSAKTFDFQEEYMLSTYETRNISDHWPIELKIRGKMSDLAEKHLSASVCFVIQDSHPRQNINNSDIYSLARSVDFEAKNTTDGILLTHDAKDESDMLTALKKLTLILSNVISLELEEAVKYKVSHGSLCDDSSFADVKDSKYVTNIRTTDDFVVVYICKTTTVN